MNSNLLPVFVFRADACQLFLVCGSVTMKCCSIIFPHFHFGKEDMLSSSSTDGAVSQLELVKRWLQVSLEQRNEFFSKATTTEEMRLKILHLERCAVQCAYRIFCESAGRLYVCADMEKRVKGSEAVSKNPYAEEIKSLPVRCVPPYLPPLVLAPYLTAAFPFTGVGGRHTMHCGLGDDWVQLAVVHRQAIAHRISLYLKDLLDFWTPHMKVEEVADTFLRVLTEACVAALYRQNLVGPISQAAEKAASCHRISLRPCVTRVNGTAASLRNSEADAVKQTSSAGEESFGRTDYLHRVRENQRAAFLGIWLLLKKNSLSTDANSSDYKRPRASDENSWTSGDSHALDGIPFWQQLRKGMPRPTSASPTNKYFPLKPNDAQRYSAFSFLPPVVSVSCEDAMAAVQQVTTLQRVQSIQIS